MNYTIIDEANEKLVVKPGIPNDTVVIVRSRRDCAIEPWESKVIILNTREAGLVYRAIKAILSA